MRHGTLACAALAAALLAGCVLPAAERTDLVTQGGFARVALTVEDETGRILTDHQEALVLVGDADAAVVPRGLALAWSLPPGLDAALIGRAVGDTVRVTLPPGQAYGASDPARVRTQDRTLTFPQEMVMPPGYLESMGQEERPGARVEVPWSTGALPALVVSNESDGMLRVRFDFEGERRFDQVGWPVTLFVADGLVHERHDPVEGVTYLLGWNKFARVTELGERMTVDENHPFAGRTLTFEVEVLALVPAPSPDEGTRRALDDWMPPFE